MNRLETAVKQRLEDKAERDPNLLRKYLSEDDSVDAAIAAFTMTQHCEGADEYQDAHEAVERIFSVCLEAYQDDNYESELAEYRAELAEMEAEHRRDMMMDERAERIAEERERQST